MSWTKDDSLDLLLAGDSLSTSSYPYNKNGPKFFINDRVEAVVGTKKEKSIASGTIIGIGENQSYTVLFDSGIEFENVHQSLLSHEENKVNELKTQLAHLEWRKIQNEAKIKNTIRTTKKIMNDDTRRQINKYDEFPHQNPRWIQNIIEDELSRPLEVTEDFMQQFEKQEDKMRIAQEINKERHLKCVDHLEKTVGYREYTATETANKISEEAAQASMKANQLHNQIIKTKHMLNVDYEMISSDELDDEDYITMELLRKRIDMLTKQHKTAYEKATFLSKKASEAMVNLRLSFQPGASPEHLARVNTNSAKVHCGLIVLRDKLKDRGYHDEMMKREKKAISKRSVYGGGVGGGKGNYDASRISAASDLGEDFGGGNNSY